MGDDTAEGATVSGDPIARALLCDIALDLLDEARRVPEVLAGSSDDTDLVAGYIRAQGVSDPANFQLPEPILHPISNPKVLVVGFNPNYGPDEKIPRYGCSPKDYVAFYADRFAPHRRDDQGRPAGQTRAGRLSPISHYHAVEQLIAEVLGTETAFGLNAVYADAIPWKWKKENAPGFGHADGGRAFHRLERIVLALRPSVILTLGENAAKVVGTWNKQDPGPRSTNGDWPAFHVASYHPDARGGAFYRHRPAVKEALEQALRGQRA